MNSVNAPDGTKSIHIFTERLSFPVCLFALSSWDETQISYLNHNVKNVRFTAYRICKWCQSHNIQYQIIFPDRIWKLAFRDPKRFLCYLYLKHNL